MPLISVTTGAYSVYYGTDLAYLGAMDENGVEISWVIKAKLVSKSDGYGESLINGYTTGADFRLRCVCKESPSDFNAQAFGSTSLDAGWPGLYTGTWTQARDANSAFGFVMPTIGAEFYEWASPVVLNAVGGLSSSKSFVALTALKAIPTHNVQRAINLSNKVRLIPVDLTLLPYYFSGGSLSGFFGWFSVI